MRIQNVNIALEKYEGNMRIDYDNKTFKVNIIIPIS
ncbi:GHKL domain-containing protein [Clostridium baratii]